MPSPQCCDSLSRAVAGSATSSDSGLQEIRRREPDVAVIDLETKPLNGVELAQEITSRTPDVSIVLLASQSGVRFYQDAMRVGASDFLIRPIDTATLETSILEVQRLSTQRRAGKKRRQRSWDDVDGRLVVLVSPRGGTGKTFITANLASLYAARFRDQVAVADLALQFGDIGTLLDLPSEPTINRLRSVMLELTDDAFESASHVTQYGLRTLLAPARPEDGDGISRDDIASLLVFLKQRHRITFVDTCSFLEERLLTVLREADLILVPCLPELHEVGSTARYLELLSRLGHSGDRVELLGNRLRDSNASRRISEVTGCQPLATLPDAPDEVRQLINQGKLVIHAQNSQIAQSLRQLAADVMPLIMPNHEDLALQTPSQTTEFGASKSVVGRLLSGLKGA